MRWRKMVGRQCHNLEKRERRRDRDQIRRYREWRVDSYSWMRIIHLMDVWGKLRERVEGQDGDGDGRGDDARDVERGDREWECDCGKCYRRNNDCRQSCYEY